MAIIPNPLSKFNLQLTKEGNQLIFTYDYTKENNSVSDLLDSLKENSIRYQDIDTQQSSLEEIFVQLVNV